ncbi:site-2 protease family protein [Desulfurobacterium thermolithotrophum]|uniref:site-2 protease family protein n=1 Tax=Desulfurobacterium thermolithotrophum TaxID=64160 RepID=UPI0013D1C446|nr:site-2 protease family protein [Desulfurobacterium thermolithotrophum]
MHEWIMNFLIALPAILWAITIHEFAHGYIAYKLGDPTPKITGRLTLNPFAHLDIIGFLALVLVHFGWAKPVMVNPNNFRIDPRKGEILVASGGPLANFLSAFVSVLVLKYFPFSSLPFNISEPLFLIFKYSIFINVAFGIFNLLPIPPLDGSKILEALLPPKLYYSYKKIEPYGPIILIILVISPLLNWILVPLVNIVINLMLMIT